MAVELGALTHMLAAMNDVEEYCDRARSATTDDRPEFLERYKLTYNDKKLRQFFIVGVNSIYHIFEQSF